MYRMNEQIQLLIERKDVAGLDALQIRGDYVPSQNAVGTDYVGYDYARQCWVEHTFIYNYGMLAYEGGA